MGRQLVLLIQQRYWKKNLTLKIVLFEFEQRNTLLWLEIRSFFYIISDYPWIFDVVAVDNNTHISL